MTQWGLDNLFNPGKRHMDDEKRRLQSTREEIGDNSKGRRIDLEAGKVSISVRRPAVVPVAEDDETALDAALEAEDVPAVALATDEAEIVPEVVDETDDGAGDLPAAVESVASVEAVATEPAAEPVTAEVTDDEPAGEDELAEPIADGGPIEAPAPAPAATRAPRRRQLSASAWSRRG